MAAERRRIRDGLHRAHLESIRRRAFILSQQDKKDRLGFLSSRASCLSLLWSPACSGSLARCSLSLFSLPSLADTSGFSKRPPSLERTRPHRAGRAISVRLKQSLGSIEASTYSSCKRTPCCRWTYRGGSSAGWKFLEFRSLATNQWLIRSHRSAHSSSVSRQTHGTKADSLGPLP